MPKIVNLGTPTSPTIYTKKYGSFRGVDFSQSETMVEDSRSPSAVNLISDTNGFPEKRLGWRTVQSFDARINGIYSYGAEGNECKLVHAGDKIYKLKDDELTLLIENISDNRSIAKYFKGKLCILTGGEYLVFDGESCFHAGDSEEMYAPITLISRETMKISKEDFWSDTTFNNWYNEGTFEDAAGSALNYGTMPEGGGVNLISGKRRNCFEKSEDGIMVYVLDASIEVGTRVTMRCTATGEELFSVIYNSSNGIQHYYKAEAETDRINHEMFTTLTVTASYVKRSFSIGYSEVNDCGFVICRVATPALSGYYHTEGVDNFSIEFTHEVEGYAERINKCTVMDIFENRVFFSGNPDYPNADWYSGVNDPLFVPDINYTEIGMDSSSIMAYLRTGDQQAILKSDGDDATIYMRSYSNLSDGSVIFPVKQGTSGIGAIAKGAVCTFLDDPLYLSRNGVYAIALQDISSERALNIRSTRVNNRLLSEADLKDAVMCEWNGYLVLCVGGNAYVADAAQKQYPLNKTNSFEYEWYYWTNIPARVLHEDDGTLYFGTDDGRICRFNDDMKNSRGEVEPTAYSDDGEAIVAEWATNLSDDGDFMRLKTMKKKGSGVMLKTYNRSGVKVCIRTDKDFEREILEKSAGIFNFEDLDFNDFTFNTSEYMVVPFNAKFKKYKAIQVICRNEKINQAFGVLGIIRRYVIGNFAK